MNLCKQYSVKVKAKNPIALTIMVENRLKEDQLLIL
jgi:hypothetical protein